MTQEIQTSDDHYCFRHPTRFADAMASSRSGRICGKFNITGICKECINKGRDKPIVCQQCEIPHRWAIVVNHDGLLLCYHCYHNE